MSRLHASHTDSLYGGTAPILGAAWLALLLLLPAGPVPATLLRPLSVDDLATHSDAVVHARVVSVHVEWNAGATMPITVVELEVVEVLDGSVGPRTRLRVTTPGGSIGGIALDYAGRPRFTPGGETVVFLEERDKGHYIPVGLVQGTFEVDPALPSGRRPLRRPLHGADMIGQPEKPLPTDLDGLRQVLRARPRNLSGGTP